MEWIPVILGTPTISHIVNVMKEREIDALAMPWANTRVVHLLSVCRAMTMMVDDETAETASSNGYDEVVFMRNMETIDAFSSHVLPAKVEKAYTGEHINVMIQALQIADGSLPEGLTIQNAYMKLRSQQECSCGSKKQYRLPQMLWKKALVARAVAVTAVPETMPETRVWGGGWIPGLSFI